jgi:hypothetical protein
MHAKSPGEMGPQDHKNLLLHAALSCDAVLGAVNGTELAICRVATHVIAVSTIRGGRDLHVPY